MNKTSSKPETLGIPEMTAALADAHDLTIQALDKGVVCASKIPALLHEWREPRYEDFEPRTVWSFFNATTEVLKGALHLLPKRSQALYELCDRYAAA